MPNLFYPQDTQMQVLYIQGPSFIKFSKKDLGMFFKDSCIAVNISHSLSLLLITDPGTEGWMMDVTCYTLHRDTPGVIDIKKTFRAQMKHLCSIEPLINING